PTWAGDVWQYESITIQAVPPTSGNWVFGRWSDGNTDNPRNLTPIDRITDLHATFKLHLGSSVSNATGPNNQRKIVTYGGVAHAVYASGGSMWYMRDDGSGWSNEVPISGGATTAKNPSIAISVEGMAVVNVVWEEDATCNGRRVVKFARSVDVGSTWQGPVNVSYCYSYDLAGADATPVVAALSSRVAVVWKSTTCLVVKMDPATNRTPNPDVFCPVPGPLSTAYERPSLVGGSGMFKLAYKDISGHVMYRQFMPNLDFTVSFGNPVDVSNPYSATNPSISSTVDQRIFVSWEADVTGGEQEGGSSGHHVFVTEKDPSTGWRAPVEFVHGSHLETNSTVCVDEDLDQAYVIWECSKLNSTRKCNT
ncbi:MAG: hypothetical protein AAB393_19485, partial [Bacteroidota bacterium]